MVGTHAIRGSRVGSGPMGEAERGQRAPSVTVSYWCAHGHESTPTFMADGDIELPEMWQCPRCGMPAGRDRENPPEAVRVEPFKTHLAYVKERRSDADGAQLLDEALSAMRARGVGSGSS
ncbi:MAG TPA: RNA polymerase-binding protein RbpA [Ornithinimicrobium sp.]|uniref:RNA polymerase-binding protein RbpA n=1 Tax=Ornithinimicrobium sp. TaxID=1977084 RepID=UPI002B4A55E5|nr:RNA polymerase-binding protein RbpA [Ornithinimicrobium sp.]HKJ11582.1 RNA polymerase-binding protein RbpA [Ornithinimicrobium sp.]